MRAGGSVIRGPLIGQQLEIRTLVGFELVPSFTDTVPSDLYLGRSADRTCATHIRYEVRYECGRHIGIVHVNGGKKLSGFP